MIKTGILILILVHTKDILFVFENAKISFIESKELRDIQKIRERRTIIKSFVTSQFGYCLLIWIFHSRHPNNKINSILGKALKITYQNMSTF